MLTPMDEMKNSSPRSVGRQLTVEPSLTASFPRVSCHSLVEHPIKQSMADG